MFRKDIEPSCAYCRRGREIGAGDVACLKCGIVSVTESCRGFIYDPYKREPQPHQRLSKVKLEPSDFEL